MEIEDHESQKLVGSAYLVCERKTSTLSWAGCLMSLEERKGSRVRRGFLSYDAASNLGSYLSECTIKELRRSSTHFKDSYCSTWLQIKSNDYGLFVEAVVIPASSKGKWVSFCFPEGTNSKCWKSLGDQITNFVNNRVQHILTSSSLRASNATSSSYKEVLMSSKVSQPPCEVHISACFKNIDEDWEKFFQLLNESRNCSRSLKEDVHFRIKTGKVTLETNIIRDATKDIAAITGEEDVDRDAQGFRGESLLVESEPIQPIPAKPLVDLTIASGTRSEPVSNSNSNSCDSLQMVDSLTHEKGLGQIRRVSKTLPIGPPYPWISLMADDIILSEVCPSTVCVENLLQRGQRKKLRAQIFDKVHSLSVPSTDLPLPSSEDIATIREPNDQDLPSTVINCIEPAQPSDSSVDEDRSKSKGLRKVSELGSKFEDIVGNPIIEALDFNPEDEIRFHCDDTDDELQRVSGSYECLETNGEEEEAISRPQEIDHQGIDEALATLGVWLGVQDNNTSGYAGLPLDSVIDDLDRKIQRAMDRPSRKSTGKKPRRYEHSSQQSSQSVTF